MHTFLYCDLSYLGSYLPCVAIRNSIRTDEMYDIFLQYTDFWVLYILKTFKVKYSKQTSKVLYIYHAYLV